MDVISENIKTGALSSNYPAYYKEFQLRNWTHLDLVVTESNGSQHFLSANKELRESEACVEIEYRSNDGMRSEITEFGMKELQIDGKRTIIPLDMFRNGPYRMMEHNIIISTIDHAYVAKQMLIEDIANPMLSETRVDEELLDPRLVFQVVDPCNRFEVLFVNVFGQTIIVRAGIWAQTLPVNRIVDESVPPDPGKLICYLRYPNDYYNEARVLTTVFEISLEHIDDEMPSMLPGGDTICIASTMEALQRVLAKKAAGNKGSIPSNMISSKMVPKELFDTAQKNHETELEKVREECKQKVDTVTITKSNEIARLKYDLDQAKREKESLEHQVKHWEAINEVQGKIGVSQASVAEAEAKAKKEAYEASRKELDNMWTVLKIVGTIATGLLSFTITVAAKSKK